MFLLTAKRRYLKEVTCLTVVLSLVVGLVYLFIPERYFVWFPVIPAFFFLYGLFNISMFAMAFRMGEDKIIPMFLINKSIKLISSILIVVVYCFVVRHEVLSFIAAFVAFYIPFLIMETAYFTKIELILKRKRRRK